MILLTPDELDELEIQFPFESLATHVVSATYCAAQLKKVVEWGNEPCPHILTQIMDGSDTRKRNCDVCWQSPT